MSLRKSQGGRGNGAAGVAADVAIVGLGPVGAVLAGLLGKRGLKAVVFDREADIYQLPRAAHIDHTGLRTLQELGILGRLLPTMLRNPGTDCINAEGKLLFRIPADRPTPSGLPASLYFHQPTFDRLLRQVVAAQPTVEVRLRSEVVGVEAGPDWASLEVRGPDGKLEAVRASWVVGCDGASSRVRESAALRRTSFGFEEQWLIFDLLLGEPRPPLPVCAVQVCDPRRPRTELPMPDNRFRYEFMLMPGEDPAKLLSPEEAEVRLLAPLLPPGAARIERTATYTFQGLVCSRWRSGRVLVAGDAAHLMPPFLGQGMCSGIRDVTNLAWKLERVLRRGAPESLLDTYEVERKPHVSAVIASAIELGRVICTTDPRAAELRDQSLLSDARPPEDRFQFALPSLVEGPLVRAGGGNLFPQPLPKPGEERLDDMVGDRFLVLASARSKDGGSRGWWEKEMGALVRDPAELPYPGGALARWFKRNGAAFAVVRPDRYVLGVTDDLEALTGEVQPWLDGTR
jgi:3-(3-hydroxy-phenyl)propionate hydroxylase